MDDQRKISNHINEINSLVDSLCRSRSISIEKNHNYIKVLAKVKCDLERGLKNPALLIANVMNCLDACREVTPYYSVDAQANKIDPPLTQEERDQFSKKFEELKGIK
jgi:hypothetical protein